MSRFNHIWRVVRISLERIQDLLKEEKDVSGTLHERVERLEN